ncbi:MAG: Uma2 family endonuclease [Lachnospiraceae bacterium]|nr:Uma2 family endonuclease [Lachnospiraceae bacterium]
MTIEEMKRRKQELGYSNARLSELSGVPLGTVQKVMSGSTAIPREETLRKLEKVLHKPAMVAERAEEYQVKKPGEYTLEDYLALPEERRVEMIDGVFYDMTAPTTVHQAIGGFMLKQLLDYVMEQGGECMPLVAPVDVQLDRDEKTVVQPDVLIVCDRAKFQNGRVFGAPDFVAEILSPSTRKKDMSLKVYYYMNAGVREYWLIDPEKKAVIVYDLEHEAIPVIYGVDAEVPVLVWGGKCRISFPLMMKTMGFLYES